MTVVARAEALARAGRDAEAQALVRAAADAGEPDALVLAAQWALFGVGAPRDPAAAKALLARAADTDVSARVLLAYLTANPACGPADAGAARAHLAVAAGDEPRLAAQLALYDGLAARALPVAERLSDSPDLVRFPGLLTPGECRWLIAAAGPRLAPSLIVDPATGAARPDPVRRAAARSFGPLDEDLVVGAVGARLAAASATELAAAEPLAVLAYRPGDEYRPHLDTVPGLGNQRAVTVLTYLNDDFAGGATVFADGPAVLPRTGDAIVFRTLDAAGDPDKRARHAGAPVTRGVKYLCSRWIRRRPHDIWSATNMRESAP